MMPSMTKIGRPTVDPKTDRVSIRLAPRDVEALTIIAREQGIGLSGAARNLLREALGVPALPKKPRRSRR